MIPRPAVRPFIGHGHPRGGRQLLRLVRRRSGGHAAAARDGGHRHRPRAERPCRDVGRGTDRQSPAPAPPGAEAHPRAAGLSRKQKGSKNREKAWVRVAVQHRKAREARADHLLRTALRLARDNRAVYVEDLAVSGLARTRLAKSVHDAGWATLVWRLEEKAGRHGRTVLKVSRWFPSSQICSACGVKGGRKPLSVRQRTCGGCGTTRDRDVNAARNIRLEGRKAATGQADALNAYAGVIRPGHAPAGPGETGTRRSAA
jgi:hypothetical protein